jgi:hypothetical protein
VKCDLNNIKRVRTMAMAIDTGIAAAVERFFQRSDVVGNMEFLSRRLPPSAEILIAGGAIRNLIIDTLHGSAPPTEDIDIFIGGLGPDFDLAGILDEQTVEPTDLKGIRWFPEASALAYDLCLLPNFLVIATCHLDPTPANLLAGIDFTMNAVIYDYGRRTLTENGCIAAIHDRIIDFNCRLIPDKFLIAYRVLLFAHKTGFRLSPTVFQFVTKRLELETLSRLNRLFRAKRGKTAASAIMRGYDRLCEYASYAAYRADWSPGPPYGCVGNR